MANLDDIQTFMEVAQFESIRGQPAPWDADLDGEPAAVGARIEARRFAPATHDATTDADCAGTWVLRSVPGVAHRLGRAE